MIGYEFLVSRIPLRMPPIPVPAQVLPVTRIEALGERVAVPRHVAPSPDATVLDHVLFALKHEPMQLAVLLEALKQVPEAEIAQALTEQKQGSYLRKAAFLWERANAAAVQLPFDTTGGNYIDLFDPERYWTGPIWEKHAKYRINVNGIGPMSFCPVVRRDDALAARGAVVLDRLRAWARDPVNVAMVDRVLSWAYLSETRDSFAIENETPSPDKERAFLDAMARLREREPLTEDYLVGLQNLVITGARGGEVAFRSQQNWLQRGGRGALSVQYVPPSPQDMQTLMSGLMQMANMSGGTVPPLVKAALVSFGFVFIHPFMDGNGRLSRLLAHHSLQAQGALPEIGGAPAILPLSVAMKRHEQNYLLALQSFSRPMRALWDVTAISEADFTFEYRSSPSLYAHWDGGTAARFLTFCAEEALAHSLIEETRYLQAYDRAWSRIDRTFDLPNRTINLLIQWIHQNGDRLPERRRNARELTGLKPEQIASIESIVADSFGDTAGPSAANETPA